MSEIGPEIKSEIIRDGEVVADNWQLITEQDAPLPDGPCLVPLARWRAERDVLLERGDIGVWLASDEPPRELGEDIHRLPVIAVDFPTLADGRGFSYGRELREQHGFEGELRAVGKFMRDQLAYLSRCGFNSFALQGADLHAALGSLRDFSVYYQVSVDNPEPLFRIRH